MSNHKGYLIMYKNLLFIFIALWSFCMNGVSRDRKELLDFGWRFLKGEAPVGSVKPDFDDGKWRIVDLPHDWSIEGIPSKDEPSGGDGGYRPNGKGCYRKTFQINKEEIGKVFGLYFEGVYMNAEVFVNGSSLGTHHYGYSPFYHDITSLIKQGENVIVVNVDNSYLPNCRWYTGSGIYRHVWLTSTNPIYFKKWGTFITTPNVSEDKADVAISTEIINSYDNERELSLTTILYGPLGDEIGRTTKGIVIKPGETLKINQLLPVQKPQCWSPDSPSLYSARLSVAENNREIDSILESFGIRTISYSAEEGFKLNGNSLLLNGGCIHHDNGPLGAAAFDRAEIRKVQLMKEAGFNAVRTSHNHPSEVFLHACDSIGLLVIDEAFDGWRVAKKPHDYSTLIDKYWKDDLSALVLRDRNHPSIFCWSVGNEVIERKEIQIITTARKLVGLCRELDPTRPVTSALCAWDSDWEIYDPLAEAFDIVGYNYMMYKHEGDHIRVPERIMIQTESYPRDAFQSWSYVNDNPYIIGDFVWTSVDYLGESSIGRWYYEGENAGEHFFGDHFPWNAAYCGDIDMIGQRKPISYYRERLWNYNRPIYMAVKEPNGYYGNIKETMWSVWPTFESWTWPGHEGKEIEVEVYSRAPRVRLTLNGKVVGEKPTTRQEEFKAVFKVIYEPGTILAEAINNEGDVLSELNGYHNELKTAGEPYAIRLKADRSTINPDGQDLSFITAEVVDKDGIVCPDATNLLTFSLKGRGTLLAVGNADIKELDTTSDSKHKAWKGKALAVVRSQLKKGKAIIAVSSQGLKGTQLEIRCK